MSMFLTQRVDGRSYFHLTVRYAHGITRNYYSSSERYIKRIIKRLKNEFKAGIVPTN